MGIKIFHLNSIFGSLLAGADLGFSRGVADFQKEIENFDDLFF